MLFLELQGLAASSGLRIITWEVRSSGENKGQISDCLHIQALLPDILWISLTLLRIKKSLGTLLQLPLLQKTCTTCSSRSQIASTILTLKIAIVCLQRSTSVPSTTENSCHEVPLVCLSRTRAVRSWKYTAYILSLLPAAHRCIYSLVVAWQIWKRLIYNFGLFKTVLSRWYFFLRLHIGGCMYSVYESSLFQSVSLCGLVDFAMQRLLMSKIKYGQHPRMIRDKNNCLVGW